MPANKIKVDNAVLKRYARQSARRRQRVVLLRILIVCEGERTEPRYFDSFKKKHNGLFVLDMDVLGLGANTLSVVNKAIELKMKAESVGIPYDSVWAVFDRDSFSGAKFNAAVQKAESNGVNAAWSNEAFELWYLYHFHNRVTAMSRDEYKKAISDAVNSSPAYKLKRKYVYEKNASDTYAIVNRYGSEENALRWAEAGAERFSGIPSARCNPCTMVYKLVRQIEGKDSELNAMLAAKIEE